MRVYLCILIVLFTHLMNAQTGIGTTTPDPSAKLEVSATNKGFLPPRVTLTSVTDATTIPSPATGLLVYNNGSGGLQAGYYYWNGASWAIIATSTVAGTGVVSSDMVKLYSKAYSTNAGDIANASGYSFTVPISGRYLFDFNSTAYSANAFFTLYFKVRQGTTDLASDFHTSVNNDIRVEYDGKVEVNLVAGTTYNVYVTGGSRNSNDYDRVYMKQVAGNLPVNVYPWVLNGNDVSTSGNVGIGNNAPTSKLDVTGELKVAGALNVSGTSNVNLAVPSLLVGKESGDEGGEIQLAKAATNTALTNKVIVDVYRDKLRLWEGGSTSKGVSIDLSKAPDGVGGELIWKVSGLVNAGTFLSLDNLKVSVTTGGSRGLSIATVSGSFICEIAGTYGAAGGASGSSASNITYSTTPSGSPFGWNFATMGDTVTYLIYDRTNTRVYRVTLIIGASYNNNFICIERLY